MRATLHDFERTAYLGFPMVVASDKVTVFSPQMRKLGQTTSVKKARLFVRGYRRVA